VPRFSCCGVPGSAELVLGAPRLTSSGFRYSVDPRGRLPAGSHREDDGGRADDDVPSGEHPFLLVFPVSWSARMFPHLFVVEARRRRRDQRIGAVPMETMTCPRELELRALDDDRAAAPDASGSPVPSSGIPRDHPRFVVPMVGDRVRQEVELDPSFTLAWDLARPGRASPSSSGR